MAKEPYVYGKRALCLWQKSPMPMAKEPYVYDKRALTLLALAYRGDFLDACWHIAKEPYAYGKRALCLWQKSPMPTAKEPYVYGKRALTLLAQAYRGDFLDACWHIAFALHYAAAQNAGC